MMNMGHHHRRLNAARKLQGRVQYFVDYREEMRLDVRNIRLLAPKPHDYQTGFQQEDDVDGIEDILIHGEYFSKMD